MNYMMNAISDIGQSRASNQDSLCVKRAVWNGLHVAMAVICDGMGGLADGELASAVVVRRFNVWFEKELPKMLEHAEDRGHSEFLESVGLVWNTMLIELNERIRGYGLKKQERLGTTFTGALFLEERYICVHIGDSRMYLLHSQAEQLTTDHTVANREYMAGRLTKEEFLHSPKRSVLTQCVGVSASLRPDVLRGAVSKGDGFMLCSDGFQHKLSAEEIYAELNGSRWSSKEELYDICEELINTVILRGEKDNISVIVGKVQ